MGSPSAQNPLKRPLEEGINAEDEDHAVKRRRKLYPTEAYYYSPRFWDTISAVYLSKRALLEFDRRTTKSHAHIVWPVAALTPRLLRSDHRRLVRSAENGGPCLDWLRGFSDMPKGKGKASECQAIDSPFVGNQDLKRKHESKSTSVILIDEPNSKKKAGSKMITPYSANFEQKMVDRDVFPVRHRRADGTRFEAPANMAEIRAVLARHRASISPSTSFDGKFDKYEEERVQATSEAKVMARVVPFICGGTANSLEALESEDDLLFANLAKFDEEVSMPQPDKYYGIKPHRLDECVREELGSFLAPSTKGDPVVPNYFLECKGSQGRSDVVERQAMYDGAIGARAIHRLQNYGQPTLEYDGKAYTLSATYHAGTGNMSIYATHPRPSERRLGETEFHTTEIDSMLLKRKPENLREGVSAYRNARDWTKEQRELMVQKANEVAAAAASAGKSTRPNR